MEKGQFVAFAAEICVSGRSVRTKKISASNPDASVAIHFGTFALGDDGEVEPVRELQKALEDNQTSNFWVLDHGEGRTLD